MEAIKYSAEINPKSNQLLITASVTLHGDEVTGEVYHGYGKTHEEARNNLMLVLADLQEISPESFVTLPPPDYERIDKKAFSYLKAGIYLAGLFLLGVVVLSILAFAAQKLMSLK